ncbi:MAG: glycine cleavage system aminomethyltransferase GcvT [Chloroherpetonaceae bacterium]|nr:glycine cleavage system aminomethyltransferase GcvT [Chloroherpetonaceae bacterium]
MKRTPFYHLHQAAGAKLISFGGFEMPVQYEGILSEHKAVRQAAGVFDVSHMGEFLVTGKGAKDFLQKVTTNDINQLSSGKAQYSIMLYENEPGMRDGGVVDDLIIYSFSSEKYLLIVNASNIEKDFAWLMKHKPSDVALINQSEELSLLALQGPRSADLLQFLTNEPLEDIGYYHFKETEVCGVPMILARTGYTGEIGFELCFENQYAEKVWQVLFEKGKDFGLKPIGLGARDTLRLEMGFALYGHEIDHQTTPYEAGLGWVTKPDKGEFLGKEAAVLSKKTPNKKLVGFKMLSRMVARQGYEICNLRGETIGAVASGTLSPMLDVPIGTGFVTPEESTLGNRIMIKVRGQMAEAEIHKPPFYKKTAANETTK